MCKYLLSHFNIVSAFSVQITDLETEDSKKDTAVDVVFKKALKEFRLNIFNSYSTALAVSIYKYTVYLAISVSL